ncbi:hypothetical protein RDV84_06630 [Lysobacter yananisis]|uniref:DUF2207 domain-containing protein n=1 Tax=Lysobacter yananisis TaxID=1003114 RepID=A0ABY9PC81_9GAMM|nr:hypothetical protein [Lysobacter yananisis]WMT04501.1 hypothetical protein RDV84_06630 [Lysobacter yananisis]
MNEPASDPDRGAAAPLRLSGAVRRLQRTVQTLSRGGRHGARVEFAVYRFDLDRRRVALYVPLAPDGPAAPPLAEGDRVELLAQRYRPDARDDARQAEAGAVVALRNHDRRTAYACHSAFRWLMLDIAPVGYTPRMLRAALWWTLGLSLLACAAIPGFALAVGSSTPWQRTLADVAALVALIDAAIWLPVAALQLRWRLGRPTRRQRYTEQVYAALGFGSPLDPAPGLIEL